MNPPDPDSALGILRRPEAPALLLEHAALAFHVVARVETRGRKAAAYPECADYRSMELDLLSRAFQDDPPLGSQCELHEPVPVTIRFPSTIQYHSEGRTMWLECPEPVRQARILVSSTAFPDSGFKVWHFVIRPAHGGRFSEFDLIRLIHLYDGRTEATGLRDQITFQLGGSLSGKASPEIKIGELLAKLGKEPAGSTWFPTSGTVQILAGGDLDHALEVVRKARSPEGSKEVRELKGWVSGDSGEAGLLKACCGIVTGIFDFDQLDDEEILDTLEPTCRCSHLIRMHRCTLVSISSEDRAMSECVDSIGMSPYLLIPHAVLLNNESLVARADEVIGEVLGKPRVRLGLLERARVIAEECLQRDFLPNIFNYATVRSLLARGWESRGAEDRRGQVTRRLEKVRSAIDIRWQRRREHGQTAVVSLLALFSVLQVRDVLFDALGPSVPSGVGWLVLGGMCLGVIWLLFAFSRMGLRE